MYYYYLGEKRHWMFDKHVGNPFNRFADVVRWMHIDDLTDVIDIVMPPTDGMENKVWDSVSGLCYEGELT